MPAVLFAALLLAKLELAVGLRLTQCLCRFAALDGILLAQKGERLLGARADAGALQLAGGDTLMPAMLFAALLLAKLELAVGLCLA